MVAPYDCRGVDGWSANAGRISSPVFIFFRHKGASWRRMHEETTITLLMILRHAFWDGFELAYQSNRFLFHVLDGGGVFSSFILFGRKACFSMERKA